MNRQPPIVRGFYYLPAEYRTACPVKKFYGACGTDECGAQIINPAKGGINERIPHCYAVRSLILNYFTPNFYSISKPYSFSKPPQESEHGFAKGESLAEDK